MNRTPAGFGWFRVVIYKPPYLHGNKLEYREIIPITHWTSRGGIVCEGSSRVRGIDPDVEGLPMIIATSYIMDPCGRLMDERKKVLAASLAELQARYDRWLETYRHDELPRSTEEA